MLGAQKSVVLLIDDDEEDFIVIQDMIADIPHKPIKIEWCSNYEDGFRMILEAKHDAYLVDYRLGAKSGLDLLDAVKETNGLKAPFILLTGQGDREVDLNAMARGASDYLVKSQLSGLLLERSIRYSRNHAHVLGDLREKEDSLRNLFDAAFEGIIVHDRQGLIIDVNHTGSSIFGRPSPESFKGQMLSEFIPMEMLNESIAAGDLGHPKAFKTSGTRNDGSMIHLEVTSKPYSYRGRPLILTACRDISERVQMEAQILQQDRLASIGLLASGLAHEIGTPLGVIRGRAEFIKIQGESHPVTLKSVDIIIAQIDRVSKLIRSLLTLARGESKGIASAVDLQQVASDVIELLNPEFTRRRIEAILDINTGTKVYAESGPLHQVFLNLLVNSIHAIDSSIKAGRIDNHRIRIFADSEGTQVTIGVEDTGCGISTENMKQLFKPFFTTKEIGVGTGLGLATSYRLIESWGGRLTVSSEVGVGTTFQITLAAATNAG